MLYVLKLSVGFGFMSVCVSGFVCVFVKSFRFNRDFVSFGGGA